MLAILLAWCAGLLIGNNLLVPALAPVAGTAALLSIGALLATRALRPGLRWSRWAVVPLLLAGVARGAATVHIPGPGTLDGHLGQTVTLEGTASRSSSGAGTQSFRLAAVSLGREPLEGIVEVSARSPVVVVPGSRVRVRGTLERLPGRAYDGSTGFDDRMERQGVLAAMASASYSILAPPPSLSPLAMAWRARLGLATEVRTRVPEPEATLLLGEMVGIRSRLPATLEKQLVASGLVHLLAVSGLKVALVASLLAALLAQAGRRAALLAVLGIFAYAAIGGGSAAALRSALMGSLALVARVLRRDPDPPRSLLMAAALMLGLEPSLAGDLSFQYSFLGVTGILLLEPAISHRLRRLPYMVSEALAVTCAAQVATLPLTAAYFHVVPLLAPVANAVALPALPVTMAMSAWVGLGLPDPGGAAALAAAGSAHLLVLLAVATVQLPVAVASTPWFAVPHALAYLAGVGTVVAAATIALPTRPGRRVLRAALATPAAGLAVAATVLWLGQRPDGDLRLEFLATTGGGLLVTAPDGARLLVDTGDRPAALGAALDTAIRPFSGGIDTLLLTGSAPAAAGGAKGISGHLPRSYLEPAITAGDAPPALGLALRQAGARVARVAAGERLQWHGLEVDLDACGAGLAVTLRRGRVVAWVCDAGLKGDGGAAPTVGLAVADLGPGAVAPEGPLAATWVVTHGTRPPPAPIGAGVLGPRLWRTGRDGPLTLSCDQTSCRRA